MLNISEAWATNVSKSTGLTNSEVRSKVEAWYSKGNSLADIKRILIWTALSRGKNLCFVSPNGKN